MQPTQPSQSTKLAAPTPPFNKTKQSCLSPIKTHSETGQLWRIRTVVNETGISRTEVYRKIAAGNFPTPVKLGAKAVAWSSRAVQAWIQSRIEGGAQ